MFVYLSTFLVFSALFIPPSLGVDHQVTVGGIGPEALKFNPQFVNASVGDRIAFVMQQSNNTVTQSTLASPCVYTDGGFDSGFHPVPDDQKDNFTIAYLDISDSDPVWVFCRQTGHCKQGMVFAVNPGKKWDIFLSNALNSSDTAPEDAASSCPLESDTGSGNNHLVSVGQNGALAFSPSNISAAVGDTVTFRFEGGNHSVVQSSFRNPCSPLAKSSSSGQVGFDSGFQPLSQNATTFSTYTITVNDTAPIWAYCGQTDSANHCQQGMVFAVNAALTGNTFSEFQTNAMSNVSGSAASSVLKTDTNVTVTSASESNGTLGTRSGDRGVLIAIVAIVVAALL